jgi:hypothetical protein
MQRKLISLIALNIEPKQLFLLEAKKKPATFNPFSKPMQYFHLQCKGNLLSPTV